MVEPSPNELCSVYSDSIPIVSTGSVWNAEDAQFVLNQGAQAVGVARVALPHPDWASLVTDMTYNPEGIAIHARGTALCRPKSDVR